MEDDEDDLCDDVNEDLDTRSSLIGHFYRGEMERVTTWRGRLDQTINWAVTIMAAILTFVFSSQDNPHYLLLIAMLTVVLFLIIDTRRYRAYDVWRARVRVLEEDLFAPVFDPGDDPEHDSWRQEFARDLHRPALKVPLFEAVGRRMRRIYLPLLLVLLAAWIARVTVYTPDETVVETASVFGVPGTAVLGLVAITYVVAIAVAFWPRERQAKGEFYDRGEEGEWKDE